MPSAGRRGWYLLQGPAVLGNRLGFHILKKVMCCLEGYGLDSLWGWGGEGVVTLNRVTLGKPLLGHFCRTELGLLRAFPLRVMCGFPRHLLRSRASEPCKPATRTSFPAAPRGSTPPTPPKPSAVRHHCDPEMPPINS